MQSVNTKQTKVVATSSTVRDDSAREGLDGADQAKARVKVVPKPKQNNDRAFTNSKQYEQKKDEQGAGRSSNDNKNSNDDFTTIPTRLRTRFPLLLHFFSLFRRRYWRFTL